MWAEGTTNFGGVSTVVAVHTVTERAVDWITATHKIGSGVDSFRCLAQNIVDADAGHPTLLRAYGTHGYVGMRSDHAAWAEGREGMLCVLSSYCAAESWALVAAQATNVSRLDLQVTARQEPFDENAAWLQFKHWRAVGVNGRRGAKAQFHCDTDGGSTAYLGSRSSPRCFRQYNKWVESGAIEYANCWRYELELKEELALGYARDLLAVDDRERAVASILHSYLDERSVNVPWSPDDYVMPREIHRSVTDRQRQLDWLNEQVKPTVARLRGSGDWQEVLKALGMDGGLQRPSTARRDQCFGNHGEKFQGIKDRLDAVKKWDALRSRSLSSDSGLSDHAGPGPNDGGAD